MSFPHILLPRLNKLKSTIREDWEILERIGKSLGEGLIDLIYLKVI